MITVINKVRRPKKTQDLIPSAEELIYDNVLPEIIKKIRRVNSNGKSLKVTISGPVTKFEVSMEPQDEVVADNIKACFE